MQIKRTIDTTKATYDLIGLTSEEFNRVYSSYQQYMYRIRQDDEGDLLMQKMRKMADSSEVII